MLAYIWCQPIKICPIAKLLTCATANLILTTLVMFAPIRFLVNFSIELSTCFLRRNACKYFIFGLAWVYGPGLSRLMLQCQCLIFFELCNADSHWLVPMASFFHQHVKPGQTDWDSQLLS